MNIMVVHERMLIGAVDSFMSTIVHVRPHLAEPYRDQLEAFAEAWLSEGGSNELDRVDNEWIESYLQRTEARIDARVALREFYSWAQREGLINSIPNALS